MRIGREFYSLEDSDRKTINLDEEWTIIMDGQENKTKNVIKDFDEIQVINGSYGPYIKKDKDNYKIPKGTDPGTLTLSACKAIIEESGPTRKRGRRGGSTES